MSASTAKTLSCTSFISTIPARVAVTFQEISRMREQLSPTKIAAVEAERDRYQLLLDINNAVVTQLGLGNLLHATCNSLRKIISHDAASISLYDPEAKQLRLHSFDLQYASDLGEGALFPLDGSPQGRAFTSHQPVLISHL